MPVDATSSADTRKQLCYNRIMKDKIRAVFSSNTECAFSSINEYGDPQVAIMGFAETPDFELIMSTSNKSRKFQNILNNPNVAVAIGWSWEDPRTVQYEGRAHILKGDELAQYQEFYFKKHPKAKEFASSPTQVYFIVKPNLIRYSDFSNRSKVEVFEYKIEH